MDKENIMKNKIIKWEDDFKLKFLLKFNIICFYCYKKKDKKQYSLCKECRNDFGHKNISEL